LRFLGELGRSESELVCEGSETASALAHRSCQHYRTLPVPSIKVKGKTKRPILGRKWTNVTLVDTVCELTNLTVDVASQSTLVLYSHLRVKYKLLKKPRDIRGTDTTLKWVIPCSALPRGSNVQVLLTHLTYVAAALNGPSRSGQATCKRMRYTQISNMRNHKLKISVSRICRSRSGTSHSHI